MQILLNGASHALSPQTCVSTLLIALGYAEKRVAVECNGAIVPRSAHASTMLESGDQIEIVQAIGGG